MSPIYNYDERNEKYSKKYNKLKKQMQLLTFQIVVSTCFPIQYSKYSKDISGNYNFIVLSAQKFPVTTKWE